MNLKGFGKMKEKLQELMHRHDQHRGEHVRWQDTPIAEVRGGSYPGDDPFVYESLVELEQRKKEIRASRRSIAFDHSEYSSEQEYVQRMHAALDAVLDARAARISKHRSYIADSGCGPACHIGGKESQHRCFGEFKSSLDGLTFD